MITIKDYDGKHFAYFTGDYGKNYSASLHQINDNPSIEWLGADHFPDYGDGSQEIIDKNGKTLLSLSEQAITMIKAAENKNV